MCRSILYIRFKSFYFSPPVGLQLLYLLTPCFYIIIVWLYLCPSFSTQGRNTPHVIYFFLCVSGDEKKVSEGKGDLSLRSLPFGRFLKGTSNYYPMHLLPCALTPFTSTCVRLGSIFTCYIQLDL